MAEELIGSQAPLAVTARSPLLRALAEAEGPHFATLAAQMAQAFCKALGAELLEPAIQEEAVSCYHFVAALDSLRLRTMQTSDCFVLHERDASHRQADTELTRALGSSNCIPVLLAVSEVKSVKLLQEIPSGRAVIVSPETIVRILALCGTRALDAFRKTILGQIHPLRIQPFDTTRPAVGNMFFGRELEMNLLLYGETQNLIITGPSKIGKTSMVADFLWRLRRLRETSRLISTTYISFQAVEGASPDEVARYFATRFRDNSYTHRKLRFEDLRSFMATLRSQAMGQLTLILDEADAICHTSLLSVLADTTRDGSVRMIVIGRGALRRHWLEHQYTGFSRFRELRPSGLPRSAALALVCDVLGEMGYAFESLPEFHEALLRITANQPFLLQHCARGLLELALEHDATTLTVGMLRATSDSFVDFSRLRSHLQDLQTPQARFTAACILQAGDHQRFRLEQVRTMLRDRGLTYDIHHVSSICEDLVINHLLGWGDSGFCAPRWDMCEIARQHPALLKTLRDEYLEASRRKEASGR